MYVVQYQFQKESLNMEFKTNTQPLADALNLGIVNANVSKFYQPSCLAHLTATRNKLIINLEAERLITQITVSGMGSENDELSVFVDNLKLKQLVNTFDTNTVDLVFAEDGLTLKSGKAKFTLAKMVDEEVAIKKPATPFEDDPEIAVSKDAWKFISDKQMYAIAMNYIHPVYTRAWMGNEGDVIVGDYDSSLFTHSTKNTLGVTCLLKDTIVNLLTSLPEGSKLYKHGKSYIVVVNTEGYEMITEFTPEYEDEDGSIGNYNSDIILGIFDTPERHISFNPAIINKFLSQADILSEGSDDIIDVTFENGKLSFDGPRVDYDVDVAGECDPFELKFKSKALKSVLSRYDDETMNLAPLSNGDEVAGITVWSNDLVTSVAGVED